MADRPDTVAVVGGFAETVVHLDMDAFFVEVERLRRPELRGRPVLVGGQGSRGVVASASYEARAQGAASAMPMAHARRIVRSAVVVPPDHAAYASASARVFDVLERFTPIVEKVSIDEAFLDIAGLRLHHGSPLDCGQAMRTSIRKEIGLPSSVGIATTKLLAKMASRDAKPDGIYLVPAGEELTYLHPKPVRALWGVGEVTQARIEELGVSTIGELAEYPRQTLQRRLGESVGGQLWDLAHGHDPRRVGEGVTSHSISVEATYDEDLVHLEEMRRELLAHADRLAGRLRRAGQLAHTVSIKVRYPDFTTVTRSHTGTGPISSSGDLYEVALALLARTAAEGRGVRLLGIAADGLQAAAAPRQLGLEADGREAVDEAVEQVRERFGRDAVERAGLIDGRDGTEENGPSR